EPRGPPAAPPTQRGAGHRTPLRPGRSRRKNWKAPYRASYGHYEKQYREWEQDAEGRANGRTPPVFIVVCNNTNVSKLVFDHVAGHETGKAHADDSPYVAPGKVAIVSNVESNRWSNRPNSIMVD